MLASAVAPEEEEEEEEEEERGSFLGEKWSIAVWKAMASAVMLDCELMNGCCCADGWESSCW